jgi:hypothetical protein
MKTETVYIVCDIDQVVGATELRWEISGVQYAIDLCESCHAIFTNLMAPYMAAGHRVKFNGLRMKNLPPKPKNFKAVKVNREIFGQVAGT